MSNQNIRIKKIISIIKETPYVSRKNIFDKLNLFLTELNKNKINSLKTLSRDIDHMKNDFNIPIDYDYKKKGFYFKNKNFTMPFVNLNRDELFSIALMKISLADYKDYPIYNNIIDILNKILEDKEEDLILMEAWIHENIIIKNDRIVDVDFKHWGKIIKSLWENKKIKISYKTAYKGFQQKFYKSRIVHPYKLINFKNEWVLLGYCEINKDFRKFNLSRMKSVDIKKEFEKDFTINFDLFIGDQFGIETADRFHKVKILFNKKVRSYIEEINWDKDFKITEKSDGDIIFDIKTNAIADLKEWILSWGASAVVLSPQFFVEEIRGELDEASKNY